LYYSLCSGLIHHPPSNTVYDNYTTYDFSYTGPAIDNSNGWEVIGMQRLTTPAPNGNIVMTVNGQVVKTMTNLPYPYWAFPSQGNTGSCDAFVMNLFAQGGTPSGRDMEIDVDYVRVYTPSGH
jgi:hypothetical protein